jgi:outer membrane receptor protein involved in Fe transport
VCGPYLYFGKYRNKDPAVKGASLADTAEPHSAVGKEARQLRLQANLENLFDQEYYPNAHSNTNITPGAPRLLRVSLTTRF